MKVLVLFEKFCLKTLRPPAQGQTRTFTTSLPALGSVLPRPDRRQAGAPGNHTGHSVGPCSPSPASPSVRCLTQRRGHLSLVIAWERGTAVFGSAFGSQRSRPPAAWALTCDPRFGECRAFTSFCKLVSGAQNHPAIRHEHAAHSDPAAGPRPA